MTKGYIEHIMQLLDENPDKLFTAKELRTQLAHLPYERDAFYRALRNIVKYPTYGAVFKPDPTRRHIAIVLYGKVSHSTENTHGRH